MKVVINISENTTNGDVVKSVFPDCEEEYRDDVVDVYNLSSFSVTFKKDWWDAPYKRKEE